MNVEPLSQQIEVATGLFAMLIVLYLVPSNAEIVARFRTWKAARAQHKSARRTQLH